MTARRLVLSTVVPALLLVVLSAGPGHAAAPNAPGVNLRWDQCYGDQGAWNRNFACDTNSGIERLVGSFELAGTIPDVQSLEMTVDIGSAASVLPAWWQMRNAGTCRQTSLSMLTLPPAGATACVDWADGEAAGGVGLYQGWAPNRWRVAMAAAIPLSGIGPLGSGQEYFAFSLAINHAKTVGTAACAGCLEPVCIFFSGLQVTSTTIPGKTLINQGANWSGSQYATWQQGYPLNILTGGCSMTGGGHFCLYPMTQFDCVLATPTSARGSTWGAVKSLYR